MNTKHVGEITQATIMARLLSHNYPVLLPFGDNQRYDLVIETANGFKRIQCKTGRLSKGAIEFPVASSAYHRGGKRRGYLGEIDFFAVHCLETGKSYLVPCARLTLNNPCSLRVDPPANRQKLGVRWASDFELV